MSALPALREELDLLPGPRLPDGQPSWTLHDPARNLFFQIDWASFAILSRWSLGHEERILAAISAETTLQLDADDVERLGTFLQNNQLCQTPLGTADRLTDSLRRTQGPWIQWLLHNYLFLRIPLVRPDAWLTRWAPRLDPLFSRAFMRLTVLAALLGLWGVVREWSGFSATLVDMLSWKGLVTYGVVLAGVKVLHELGHAVTAKRFGCRVPTMGIAFLVLWPVAYTDTNEVWRLTRRDQRLKVAAAGVCTELAVAAWATLAWVWLPDGAPKSMAFLLSTTTWVSSIVVNASPFLRYDGYFLLSDALRLPNLHARSFALARWALRERLFALGEPPPEHFRRTRHLGLILFAYATWAYRLALFLAIALMVYHLATKAVGIGLFAVEIGWFLIFPLWSEMKIWRSRWPAIRNSRRARLSATLALLCAVLVFLPWPTRVWTSALLRPAEVFVVYAPQHARITALPYADDSRVPAGALLIGLDSPDLTVRSAQNSARRERLSWQSAAAGFDPHERQQWQSLNEQLAAADAEGQTVKADAARYAPLAPYAGTLRDLQPDLRVGDWVREGELLTRLVRDGPQQVVTYVDDEDIHRIAIGDSALFVSDGRDGPDLHLKVVSIDRDASRALTEPELATVFGGHIVVREKGGILYPERAVYRVLLTVVDSDRAPQHAWRGRVAIAGAWEAPGMRFVRKAASVFMRESGF